MKIRNIVIILSIYMASTGLLYGKCEKAYTSYRRAVIASPVTAPAISTTHLSEGAYSTFGNLTRGALITDTGLTTAGTANGLAFSYEGEYYLEMMSTNLRHFRGRSKVLKVINQAKLGMGEELENLLDDLNESSEEQVYDIYSLADLISSANQKKVFCPEGKELFTFKNLFNYLLNL